MQHIVLVSQRERRVEEYTRQEDGSFRFEVLATGHTLSLDRIGVKISVDEVYAGAFDLPGDDG